MVHRIWQVPDMNPSSHPRAHAPSSAAAERFDVVIVGAGISGIGSACMLRKRFPGMSFVILDALDAPGGTWLIHKYPGTRSDSDLFTFGFGFKPWRSDRDAPADPRLSPLRHRRCRTLPAHPLSPPRAVGALVERARNVAARTVGRRGGRAPAHRSRLPLDVPGVLPPRCGLHAGLARAG